MAQKGVTVCFVEEDDQLAFPDNTFDLVINSHESFDIKEVKRVLKKDGWFITQQVGDLNGIHLASKLSRHLPKTVFDFHLSTVVERLQQQGFQVVYQNEAYPSQHFLDMDGLIYYLKTIPWKYPDFSVGTHLKALEECHRELQQKGFIYNQQHRFIIVAQVQK